MICWREICKIYKSVIGGNSDIYQVEINNKNFIVSFEDIGAQETFYPIRLTRYPKNKNCIIFVFDITDRKGLDEIKKWI